MDYRDNVFIAVAENLSFSKAAKELFISQPAVTNHIKELEQKLNTSLFDRKGNKIYLTKAGTLSYNQLKKIKQLYRELEFDIERMNKSYRGELRIGASSTIAQYLIPSVISSFYKRYPHIDLYLLNGNSREMLTKLHNNEIDLALVENQGSEQDLKYFDLIDDEIVAITSQNSVYSKLKHLTLQDFTQMPLVMREKGSGTLQVIQNTLEKHQVNFEELNTVIHLGSTEAIKNFLSDFDGIALVSEKSISKELKLNEISKLNIQNISFTRKFRIALNQGHIPSVTKLFMDYITDYKY